MREVEMSERGAVEPPVFLYLVVGGASGLTRLGVASDPGKRLRELQVGSPLPLRLAGTWPYPERLDAEAVVEELERRFADRRVRGRWYRLGLVDVRSALANPATRAAPANAAAARAAAAAEAAAAQARLHRRRGQSSRARTEKELDYQLRRRRQRRAKQKRVARLIARDWTQTAAAAAAAVTTRTLRNWKHDPHFRRELERQRQLAAQEDTAALPARRRARRTARPREPKREPGAHTSPAAAEASPPAEQPDPAEADAFAEIEARRLDSNQARRGELTPAELNARTREQEEQRRERPPPARVGPIIRW